MVFVEPEKAYITYNNQCDHESKLWVCWVCSRREFEFEAAYLLYRAIQALLDVDGINGMCEGWQNRIRDVWCIQMSVAGTCLIHVAFNVLIDNLVTEVENFEGELEVKLLMGGT